MSEFQQQISEFRECFVRVEQNREPVKRVVYGVANGLGVFEGDIILGTAEELARTSHDSPLERMIVPAAPPDGAEASIAIVGIGFRWPGNTIPFVIDDGFPNQARVTDAIAHWEARTPIRFVRRTTENDFVRFISGDGCFSTVGRRGGEQQISLGPGCGTGNAIHEIGHTVGLWHEQSRSDRDSHIRVNFANIDARFVPNFNQHISDGVDIGDYDFGSIMHYPPNAFSKNGLPTIEALSGNPTFGQRTALSAGDISGVVALIARP